VSVRVHDPDRVTGGGRAEAGVDDLGRGYKANWSPDATKEMDTSGDGFFAIFPDPAQAIDAARSIQADLHGLDLRARAGIHLGDCWVADGKCTSATAGGPNSSRATVAPPNA
jgi:class 3 adenylate cyclase